MPKSILSDEKRMELIKIYRDNPSAAARDLLGVELAPHQRVMLKSMWDCNNVIVVLNRGAGKCERYKNLVQTREGFKKIGDICTENSTNMGFSDYNKEVRGENGFKNSTHTYINDAKPIYNIITYFGYEKGAVDKHRIRVFENGIIKWKRFDEIKVGDYTVIERDDKYDFKGTYNEISVNEAYLIGALIGDGCFVKKSGIGFTNVDEDIISEFDKNFSLIGAYKFSRMKCEKEFCLLFGGRTGDNNFFNKYKIKRTKSIYKEIPETILRSNKESLAAFLSGLFDTDGSVTKRGIEISSASELLIEQTQVVLLSYGIVSKRRKKMVKYKDSRRVAWILTIESGNIDLFYHKIGFRCKRKQEKLKLLLEKTRNQNKDIIPGISSFLLDVRARFLSDKTEYKLDNNARRLLQMTHIKKYNVSYRWLGDFLSLTKDIKCESYNILKDIYDRHYFFDQVKTIEILPDEVTYDFSIPDGHNFISNGFISHNTFSDAVFAVLRALLFPGEKVGIFGPSYRQSKFIFDEISKIYDISPILRDSCEKKPTKMVDLCYLQFKSTGNRPGSVIHALPLGSGDTIRGARYFTIIGDEAAQIPREVLDVVVRGMMATSKNPMEQVKAMEEQKRLLAEGKIDKIKKLHNNKIVLSSTAYYQYNHLWTRVRGYIDIIMEKAEKAARLRKSGLPVPPDLEVELRGHDLNNQIPFNIMKDENRALIAFNCEDMPDGFMNIESIEEAKREMPRYQYLMEYFGYFPPDSEGFFPMSLLDKSRKHGDFACEFSFDHNKEKDWITIMGCDPARSGDNFAISIFKVNIKTEKIRLIRVLTYNKMTFPYMHIEIRKLRKQYDISEIAIDSGGGGQTIRDLLADPKICPPGDDIILQRDFDEHRFKHGKRILRLVEFSKYEWLADANNNLLLGLQNGTLQIAGEKGSLKSGGDFEETPEEEEARREIDKTIEEMQNIVVTRTQTGRMHWDTPQKRQRKDRYSAVLIGYDQAYSYLDNINKPQSLVSGFWAQ